MISTLIRRLNFVFLQKSDALRICSFFLWKSSINCKKTFYEIFKCLTFLTVKKSYWTYTPNVSKSHDF